MEKSITGIKQKEIFKMFSGKNCALFSRSKTQDIETSCLGTQNI